MIAHPIGKKQFQLYCSGCKKACDMVDWDEFLALSKGTYGPYFCFDCDPGHADEIPVNLLSDEFPYLLKLGDQWHLIDPWKSAKETTRRFFLTVKAYQEFINDIAKAKK